MSEDIGSGTRGPERAAGVQVADRAGRAAGSSTPAASFAFVIATLNGASTIAATVAACAIMRRIGRRPAAG